MNRSLLISTGIGCGVLCSYCPQASIGTAYKQFNGPSKMSFELFKRCADKLPKDVIVDFTGYYEPFLNPDCTQMILYAHDLGLSVRLSTTVMGLTAGQVDQFKHIPFTKFAVHLPDTKGLTRIIVDDSYLEAFQRLIDSDISNMAFHVHEGDDGPEAPHETVDAILSAHGLEAENRWINTRAGNIEIKGRETPERLQGELAMCPRIYQSVLMPSGDVALCCMDWTLEHVIGNLVEGDYDALFEGPVFQEVLRGYKDDTVDILCRTCEVARTKKQVEKQDKLQQFVAESQAKRASLIESGQAN